MNDLFDPERSEPKGDLMAIVNKQDPSSKTAVMQAAKKSNPAIVAMLIKKGADLALRDIYGDTALHLFLKAQSPNSDCLSLLVAAGADVTVANNFGETPLHIAARFNLPWTFLQPLINAGGDISATDNQGLTLLMVAANYGCNSTVEFLCSRGIDIEARDIYGRTALKWAMLGFCSRTVKVLVSHGAELGSATTDGQNPLIWFADKSYAHATYIDVMQALVEVGVPLDESGGNRYWTPLFYVAFHGNITAADYFINAGADPYILTASGQNLLHVICKDSQLTRNAPALLDLLIERKIKLDPALLDNDNNTPPHLLYIDEIESGYRGWRVKEQAVWRLSRIAQEIGISSQGRFIVALWRLLFRDGDWIGSPSEEYHCLLRILHRLCKYWGVTRFRWVIRGDKMMTLSFPRLDDILAFGWELWGLYMCGGIENEYVCNSNDQY